VDVLTHDFQHLHAFLFHVIFVGGVKLFEGLNVVKPVFPVEVRAYVVAVSYLLPLTDLVIGNDIEPSRLIAVF